MPGLGLMKVRAKGDRERAVPSIGEAVASRADSVHFLFPPFRVDRRRKESLGGHRLGAPTQYFAQKRSATPRAQENLPLPS